MHRKIIRSRIVCEKTGFSRWTINRLEKVDRFPRRVRLNPDDASPGAAIGWYEDEIDAWIHSRIRGGCRPVRRDPPEAA